MGRGKKWSPEEDAKLIRYVKENGVWNWSFIPEQAGLLRSAKSCNSRYNDYLRHELKKGNFTREEEATIVSLHQVYGNNWATIAEHLPGRNNIEIKNHWRHNIMKKLRGIIKDDGTSEMVMLPNFDNGENQEKSQVSESCTSSSSSAVREELTLSSTNLEQFELADVNIINNSLAESSNLSSGIVGEGLAWPSTDLELYGCAEMGIFNDVRADDNNLNYGGDGGGLVGFLNSSSISAEELAYPTGSCWYEDGAMMNSSSIAGEDLACPIGSLWFGCEDGAMVNDCIDDNENINKDDLAVNTPTGIAQGSDEVHTTLLVSTPGLIYDDLGWNDAHLLDSSWGDLNYEGYLSGTKGVAVGDMVQYPEVRSNLPQVNMSLNLPTEIVQGGDEVVNNLMEELRDDSVGGHGAQ